MIGLASSLDHSGLVRAREPNGRLQDYTAGPVFFGALRGWGARNTGMLGPTHNEYVIVDAGKLAGVGAHSYTAGNSTAGSDEAARFKKG